ncbi:MAG: hypothetical protein COA62_08940 [Rhodobiaceae bacterium]|nr:MAG: hypothetical protein COA62_08940 [Rhodobiaceae bacterium]
MTISKVPARVGDVATRLRHESSRVIFAYWLSLNDGRLPDYKLWDPIAVPKLMPWCTIVERGGETGFQLRFAGTAVCDFYGEEMTGQAIGGRMDEQARAYYFDGLEEVLTRPCACFMTMQARSKNGRDCLFESLSLPLANADGKSFRIMNHQVIIEEVTYGETKSRFALPDITEWIDIGAGVPDD